MADLLTGKSFTVYATSEKRAELVTKPVGVISVWSQK
jgi:hypothetical protein